MKQKQHSPGQLQIWDVCVQDCLGKVWYHLEHHTSGLVSMGSIQVQGLIIQFQKRTGFAQDSWISYLLQLLCLRTPLLPFGYQSNVVSLESYFKGESNTIDIVG